MYQNKEVAFKMGNGGTLKISAEVFLQFQQFIQIKDEHNESGGVLLGRYIKKSSNIIIDKISTPQSKDKSSPTRFYKNKEQHQTIVDQAWKQSNGTCNFLGEWHTHPEDYPSPSSIDLNNWTNIISKASFEGDSLFFIIVGRKIICAYEVNKISRTIIQLK